LRYHCQVVNSFQSVLVLSFVAQTKKIISLLNFYLLSQTK